MAVAAAAAAPAAEAGQYQVYSCKTPSGAVAPTEGWTADAYDVAFSSTGNACSSGGPLTASLHGNFSQKVGARLSWHWAAPANTQLRGMKVWRSVSTTLANEMNATPAIWISRPTNGFGPDVIESCVAAWGCASQGSHGTWNAAGNLTMFGDATINGSNDIYLSVGCNGTMGWNCADRESETPMADLRIHAAQATLEDASDPVPTGVGGTLTQSGAHKGVRSITFTATDTGAGIYRGIVEVKQNGASSFSPISKTPRPNDEKCSRSTKITSRTRNGMTITG